MERFPKWSVNFSTRSPFCFTLSHSSSLQVEQGVRSGHRVLHSQEHRTEYAPVRPDSCPSSHSETERVRPD
eukprot:3651598-Rhodomonas_salina.2